LADPSGQIDTRGVTLADLKAGVKLLAGHQVVLVVGDLAGSKRDDGRALKQPAEDKPPSGAGTESTGLEGNGTGPAGTGAAPAGARAGAAGAGPAGAGAGPAAEPAKPKPLEDKFAEAQVLNAKGEPAAGVFYELKLPDGTLKTGKTDEAGNLKIDAALQSGECTLVFPDYEPKKA